MTDWNGKFVETADLRIHYVREGKGAPVVLLHGWPEFCRVWKHNIGPLAQHFDVIAPDLRGFGQTQQKGPRREGGTPPELLAKDLRDLADALGLKKFGIVSHDVGAFSAQTFAHLFPGRVAGLFFFNCPYPGIGQRWGEVGHAGEVWYQQFHQKDFAASLVGSSREACRIYFRHFLRHWAHDKHAFDADLEEWVDNFMANGNLQGGFDWYKGIGAYRRRLATEGAPKLPKIKAPSQFLWGRHDPIIKYEWTDRLGDFFEDFSLVPAENAGHFVHYEQPALANAEMTTFFQRVLAG